MRLYNHSAVTAALMIQMASVEARATAPEDMPQDRPTRNRPSGNTPVPGGGARERARRLARMHATNPDGVTEACDVCGNQIDVRADACHHCG